MIDLKEGEIVCDKCSGTGRNQVKNNYIIRGTCPKCFGRGKLDWIENITGIKRFLFNFHDLPKIKPELLKDFLFKPSLKFPEQEEQKNSQPDRIVFRKLTK